MKKLYLVLLAISILCGCKTKANKANPNEIIITFGSCNKHDVENVFWDDILAQNPDVFIWGGDIIYADTDDVEKIQMLYDFQDKVEGYAALKEEIFVTGTWDDHDYGLNDGGVEFSAKEGSQQAFLNFMDVPETSTRRTRKGVYSSQLISKPEGHIKIINLDTRYFRTALTPDTENAKRYIPNEPNEGTILGDEQWQWLEAELKNSDADFNLIVSSIQFLSNAHGFEKWANHPSEVEKMKQIIIDSKAKGVVFLSGDRHISEFSKTTIKGLSYPLVDFTSSGLTHSYTSFKEESNPYRVKEVVSIPSYGYLALDLKSKNVVMRIMGNNGVILQELKQSY